MDKQEIIGKINNARLQRMLNNHYSMDTIDHITGIWSVGDAFTFAYEDHGVRRLTFFAKDWRSVDELLKKVDGGSYYMEFMTKDPNEYKPADSTLTARMMRLANADCRSVFTGDSPVLQYRDNTAVLKPGAEDVKEINSILWDIFRTEISHLLSDDELKEKLDQFTVHKSNGSIDALLQAEVMPKKFYINQIVNRGEKRVIHALLLNRLEQYVEAGGKYLYAWVEENNIASLKFHAKYGLKHDGMWSVIYRLER